MIKKIIATALSIVTVLVLVACATSQTTEDEKSYDDDFMTSLAKGLEKRWAFARKATWTDSTENYTKELQIELDEVEEYKDKKFDNSELQELAISYINELKNGQEIASTYGADRFDTDWSAHEKASYQILVKINDIKGIPVSDSNTELLNELLSTPSRIDCDEAINSLVSSIVFAKDESDDYDYYFSTYIDYTATVKNTTDYTLDSLSITVELVNAEGVTVDTDTVYVDNWEPGEAQLLEFTTDKEFATMKLEVDDYTIDD